MDPTTVLANLPSTIDDFESEVRNAKTFAWVSLLLLVYIAAQVSRSRR